MGISTIKTVVVTTALAEPLAGKANIADLGTAAYQDVEAFADAGGTATAIDGKLAKSANLSDVEDAAEARSNIGAASQVALDTLDAALGTEAAARIAADAGKANTADLGDLATKDTIATADIDASAVTNAKLANMGEATIKGRASGAGTGAPVDLTAAQARTILNVEDGAQSNVIAGSVNYRFGGYGVPVLTNGDDKVFVAADPRTGNLHFAASVSYRTATRIRQTMFGGDGLDMAASTAPVRFGDYGTPVAVDDNGVVAVSVRRNGKLRAARGFDGQTLAIVREQLDLTGTGVGALVDDLPGWNHRTSLLAGHITATMPTPFGPVDANIPINGIGNALALSNGPVELDSTSGQSNVTAGSADPDADGDVTTGGDDSDFGQILRGWRDPHRCFRGNILRYSTSASTGLAPSYAASGGMSSILPAGFDAEVYGTYSFSPDRLQFSIIAMDQYFQRPQTVHLQQTSAQGGTDLTEYMPGQTKGNNIAGADGLGGYIYGAQSYMQSNYGRQVIMRCHYLWGHEAGPVDGDGVTYLTYAELLSAFADYVCDAGEGLAGNVAAGVRPVVITYQPNQSRGTVDYKTYSSGGTLGTLDCALTDPDVISIGGVYDEKTADGGIHMVQKLMTAEKKAYARDAWVHRGVKILPPYIDPENAVIDGSVIIMPILTNFPGPIKEDTDWLPEAPMGGLFYDDDSHSATITSVEIVNEMSTVIGENTITRTLRAQLSGVPSGANPTLYVAGRNNNGDNEWSGGLCSFYIPGIPSFWHRQGMSQWCTPEIRWRLCPQVVPLTVI